MSVPDKSHQRCGQSLVQSPRRERRHTRRLHAAVKRLVVRGEALVMRTIPRLVNVEDRHHQARPVGISTNTTRGLDVLGAGLGLPEHHHQSQPRDVQTHRDHVGRDPNIHMLVMAEGIRQPLLRLRNASRIDATSQLDRFIANLPAIEQSCCFAFALSVCVPLQPVADFVFNQPAGATKLT